MSNAAKPRVKCYGTIVVVGCLEAATRRHCEATAGVPSPVQPAGPAQHFFFWAFVPDIQYRRVASAPASRDHGEPLCCMCSTFSSHSTATLIRSRCGAPLTALKNVKV